MQNKKILGSIIAAHFFSSISHFVLSKKKVFVSSKDKQDWLDFTKNLSNLPNKDLDFSNYNKKKISVKKLDLHGASLNEANKMVKT